MKITILLALAIMLIAAPVMAGFLVAPVSYNTFDTSVAAPSGGYLAALELYKDGFVLFNGNDVVLASRTGVVEKTLYSCSGYVYGSFVKVVGDKVYFGENGIGQVGVASLDGSGGRVIGIVPFNYDFAVNSKGQSFVVTGSAWGDPSPSAKVYAFDTTSGDLDLIASIPGASGPIAFDKDDDLYYGSVSPIFGQTGGQSIYRWSASQVAGAVGEASLSTADAAVVASDIDSPSSFALDESGALFFTSSVASPGTIWKVSKGSVSRFCWIDANLGISWLTGLRYDACNHTMSVIGSWFNQDWSISSAIGTIEHGKSWDNRTR